MRRMLNPRLERGGQATSVLAVSTATNTGFGDLVLTATGTSGPEAVSAQIRLIVSG
jgi:hypothetical protein